MTIPFVPPPAPASLKETPGGKLRRLAGAAALGNPFINPPWIAPQAWASGIVVQRGEVRSNAGKLYIAVNTAVGGVTTGATAPTSTTNALSNDGAVNWSYLGPAWPAASDPAAPTLTIQTTNPTLPRVLQPFVKPASFKAFGGTPVADGNGWQLISHNLIGGTQAPAPAGVQQPLFGKVRFRTDADKVVILLRSNNIGTRVIVDGRYVTLNSLTTGTSNGYAIVDFSSVGPHKWRTWEIENGKSQSYFLGIQVGATDQVVGLSPQDPVRFVAVSDSIFAGAGPGPYMCGGEVPSSLGHLLGWSDCWNMSTGGTGYIATASGTAYTFQQRIQDTMNAGIIATADVVMLAGSPNDIGQSSAILTPAVTAALQAVRAINPTCVIIGVGVWPFNNAALPATEAAVQAGFTAFSDPVAKTFFIPLYGASPLPVITGSWNNSADTTSVNSSLYLSTQDNEHPTEIGTRYLSAYLADRIRTTVLPGLA